MCGKFVLRKLQIHAPLTHFLSQSEGKVSIGIFNMWSSVSTRLSWLCREAFPGQADDVDFFRGWLIEAVA
jgi:hypothetical protein